MCIAEQNGTQNTIILYQYLLPIISIQWFQSAQIMFSLNCLPCEIAEQNQSLEYQGLGGGVLLKDSILILSAFLYQFYVVSGYKQTYRNIGYCSDQFWILNILEEVLKNEKLSY